MTYLVDKVINNPFLQLRYPRTVGMVLAIITFITIAIIIGLSIEWDGSKPGGWGYGLAPFAIFAISLVSGFVMYVISNVITRGIILYKLTNELNKNPEKEKLYRKNIRGYESLFN
jgi:hypothetical protein